MWKIKTKFHFEVSPSLLFFIVQVGAAAKRVKSSHCFDRISLATANQLKLPAAEGWLTTDPNPKISPLRV